MMHAPMAALALATLTTPALAFHSLPANQPVHLKDITAVCTGIGANEEDNPAWRGYPVKIVVAGKAGQYLAGADLTISNRHKTLASLACDRSVIYVKLDPGRYRLAATRESDHAKTLVWAFKSGQNEAVLRFPKQGGLVSAEYLKSLRDKAQRTAQAKQARR